MVPLLTTWTEGSTYSILKDLINAKVSEDTCFIVRDIQFTCDRPGGWRTSQPRTFQPQDSTLDLSTMNFGTINFSKNLGLKYLFSIRLKDILTPDFSTPDFSTMNFLTPWFQNSWLISLGLKRSWLRSPGLKLRVEKSGVEMSFNQPGFFGHHNVRFADSPTKRYKGIY